MKKPVLGSALAVLASVPAMAQLPVSTTPQNRKVVLEEFTGIHCQYCPDGHRRANDLKAAKPAGDVLLVNIHTGGYAIPGAGEPDYRTAAGTAIEAIPAMKVAGYPTGSVNRHTWAGQAGITVNRGEWAKYADSVLAKSSYVNVALQGTLDVQTRILTVNAEVYYTGNAPVNTNCISVMLVEDSVYGPQTAGQVYYPAMINPEGSYTHNHLLRRVLNANATGDTLTGSLTTGTKITKTYTYTLPAQFVNNAAYLGNLELIGLVSEGAVEIMTAAYGPITLTNFPNTKDASLMSGVLADAQVCAGKLSPTVKVYNNGSTTITSTTFSSSVNGGTATTTTYNGTIPPATFKFVPVGTVSFTPAATNTLNIEVTGVNGSADQIATNNTVSKPNIALTTNGSEGENVTMNFTQDRYGSESSWKLLDEATGNIIAQDGPFTDLGANGVQLNSKTFSVAPNTCYKLIVSDAFGDGINSGAGAGKYELKSNGKVVLSSNGSFTTSQSNWFKSAQALAGVAQVASGNAVRLTPNPTRTDAVLQITLDKAASATVTITDGVGRVVYSQQQAIAAGTQNVTLPTAGFAAGLYNVTLRTDAGVFTERLSVVK